MHCWFLSTGGGSIPACIAGFQAHTQTPRENVGGVWPGGSPGPHPGWKLMGLAWGPGGPTPWGVGIPACTEADYPSRRLLLRAVRILLECILVLNILS